MTRKMPPLFCREYDGASSSKAVTLERSFDIEPAAAIVAAFYRRCKYARLLALRGHVRSRHGHDQGHHERDDDTARMTIHGRSKLFFFPGEPARRAPDGRNARCCCEGACCW